VRRNIIGHLSKGYRQRVGLADALVHEAGADHSGRADDRARPAPGPAPCAQLIKDLGRHHTVLYLDHILFEVEMTCNRVLIMHEGKILAQTRRRTCKHHERWRPGDRGNCRAGRGTAGVLGNRWAKSSTSTSRRRKGNTCAAR